MTFGERDGDEMEQVVVSAGEPVAWNDKTLDGLAGCVLDACDEVGRCDLEQAREGLRGGLPALVVLPESLPDDLIEQMAKADHDSTGAAMGWHEVREEVRQLYRDGARAQFAVLRSWVAGGGETR